MYGVLRVTEKVNILERRELQGCIEQKAPGQK